MQFAGRVLEAHLDIQILLTGAQVEEERISAATRALLKDIRLDADPQARLITSNVDVGSKGDAYSVGAIAAAVVTGGALTKLVECFFKFLTRNRRLAIQVQNSAGEKLKVDMDFVDHHGLDKAMALTRDFVNKGG
jgi:hypothetical protein